MRLNSYISSSGICSRREADKLIEAGKVTVNGKRASVGQQVEDGDAVKVNGKLIVDKKKPKALYIALNKPAGITCTTENHVKGNIVDYVNHRERIFPIGRLDKESEGLILLTNDGSIVNEILRAENNHEKEYVVTVDRPITETFLKSMADGVTIYNPVKKKHEKTRPCKIKRVNDRSFAIVLSQGLNRQIRRMCQVHKYEVVKLKRVRIDRLKLGDIPTGKWRYLNSTEVNTLRRKK
ncbi:ribosomal large subunit pseudouridine synthase F [Andreesenia angusta]|uniref:Pseudouridine synthase n=1 Tax=Andreesenia angusta TaxID=39480 RepID=A0A1S1V598_9FIRM|nr:pseudouridine synthase [Andreesenia angusta]OHW61823.1 ribosomal large subunit pseudouridine synthase F [Andreesenia angusta]